MHLWLLTHYYGTERMKRVCDKSYVIRGFIIAQKGSLIIHIISHNYYSVAKWRKTMFFQWGPRRE